jgi:hypothetical protein
VTSRYRKTPTSHESFLNKKYTNNNDYGQNDYRALNQSLLSSNAPLNWYANARRQGQSLRLGNIYGDKGSSLWICLKTGAWKDHATGEKGSDLISLYAAIHGLSQFESMRELQGNNIILPLSKAPKTPKVKCNKYALKLWSESAPASGTIVEAYLRARGITISIPNDIRFLTNHEHKPTSQFYPVMIAAIRDTINNDVTAIHRTYLDPQTGLKANINPNKMMLGNVLNGSVQLSSPSESMIITEGIETGLSVLQMTDMSTWAALSTSGLTGLKLPSLPLAQNITIACDNDIAGICAAKEAAEKWALEGRKVKISYPPEGKDFNDVLMEVK